jgi:hypothetical protein
VEAEKEAIEADWWCVFCPSFLMLLLKALVLKIFTGIFCSTRYAGVVSLLCCVARVGMLARPIHLKYSLEIVKARRLCMPLLFSDADALLLIATSSLNFIQDPVHST